MENVFSTVFRLLAFRLTRAEFLNFGWRHLAFGLVCTWLAGIGRYWDHQSAAFLQKLDVGSLLYVFIMADGVAAQGARLDVFSRLHFCLTGCAARAFVCDSG